MDRPPTGGIETLGLVLLALGVGLAVLGLLLVVGGRFGLGSLPGDLRFGGEKWGCFVPITTSIVISLILTLLLNLLLRRGR